MRKFYTTLAFILFTTIAQSQIVTIPDANFKLALLNYQPAIDTNSDGEIQVSEAQAVTTLDLTGLLFQVNSIVGIESFSSLVNLNISYASISSFTPIYSLTNLQSFQCIYYDGVTTTLNLTSLINLQILYCDFANFNSIILNGLNNLLTVSCTNINQLNSLSINNLTNLNTLLCSNCPHITSLGFNGLPNLQYLDCSYTQISSLNLTSLGNLQTLKCLFNYSLTNLNLNGLINLQTLDCSSCGNLINLDLSNLSNLQTVNCSDCGLTNLTTTGANNITSLNCSSNQLSAITVTNMTNLQMLNCSNINSNIAQIPSLSSLDLTGLTNLTVLNCSHNSIQTLNLSNLNQLTHLICNSNQLTNLEVSNLINLTYLDCSTNQLTTLDVSALVNLNRLHCDGNQLTNIDVSNLHNLVRLGCSSNQLTNLNVSNLEYLTTIDAGFNLFTSLDFSTTGLSSDTFIFPAYTFAFNPNLTYINFKNGKYFGANLNFISCPNLQYICADDQNIQSIQQELSYENCTNVQVNSYCTFVPGGVHNTITGTATLDINNNGCDTNDIHPKDLKININDGSLNGATFCDNNGTYSFFTQNGNFVLTPQFQNSYFTVNPVSTTLNFPLLDGSTQTQDFCITPNGVHNDVDVTILPIGNARPGFDAYYQLVYKNKGNQTLSGNLTFTFDDSILDFVTANPSVNSQSVNNLNWTYSNLLPFESRTILLTLNVNSPMETPPVTIGDNLMYSATINPISGDETASDNTFNLNQTVMGSFDPNDKICLEGATISPAKVGDYLHYIIHFQNSGTAPAENIVIKDVIDTTKFDISTLQLTAASHPQVTRITGNKAEFIFEAINLPAEQDNEPASHGFVAFKVKTNSNLVVGNSVANTADIYFDYNFPIVTNTATTTITTLGINEFENKSVAVAPNPTKNEVTITSKDTITSVQLFDVQGRLIETKLNSATEAKLDVSNQLSGIYFIKVYTENGVKIEKIIKE